MQELCFPGMDPWEESHLKSHLAIFPEGQLIAELDGEIIGSCSSLSLTSMNTTIDIHGMT